MQHMSTPGRIPIEQDEKERKPPNRRSAGRGLSPGHKPCASTIVLPPSRERSCPTARGPLPGMIPRALQPAVNATLHFKSQQLDDARLFTSYLVNQLVRLAHHQRTD